MYPTVEKNATSFSLFLDSNFSLLPYVLNWQVKTKRKVLINFQCDAAHKNVSSDVNLNTSSQLKSLEDDSSSNRVILIIRCLFTKQFDDDVDHNGFSLNFKYLGDVDRKEVTQHCLLHLVVGT